MRHEKFDTTREYYIEPSNEAKLKALAAASAHGKGFSGKGQS